MGAVLARAEAKKPPTGDKALEDADYEKVIEDDKALEAMDPITNLQPIT